MLATPLTSDDHGRCKQGRAGGADTALRNAVRGCGASHLDRGIRQASWRRWHRSHAFGAGYKVNGWRKGAGFLGQAAPEASGTDFRMERPFKMVSPGGARWDLKGQRAGRGQLCEARDLKGILPLMTSSPFRGYLALSQKRLTSNPRACASYSTS